jgi:protein required for attachment to host cells
VFATYAALAITVATITIGVRVSGEANINRGVVVFHNHSHGRLNRWAHRSSWDNLVIVAVVDTDVVALFTALGSVVLADLFVSAALDLRNRRRHRRSNGRRDRRSDGRRHRRSHRWRDRNSWNDIRGRR